MSDSVTTGKGTPVLQIPQAVQNIIRAYVHNKLRWLDGDEIESVVEDVFMELERRLRVSEPSEQDWRRLGLTIANSRCMSRLRKYYVEKKADERLRNLLKAEAKSGGLDSVQAHFEEQHDAWMVARSREALLEVTSPGSRERVFVERLLESIASGTFPSFRELSRDIWPDKGPQIGSRKFIEIAKMAREYLKHHHGIDG